MYFNRLLQAVESADGMPIEIEDLGAILVEAGCQDEILFIRDPLLDPSVLRGIHYRYTSHPTAYGEPKLTTLIIYAEKQPLEMQRLVCCKELIHCGDHRIEQTRTGAHLDGLLNKLLEPLTTENFSFVDAMAAKDRLATYQAIAILFPMCARQEALTELAAGTKSVEDIARWVKLPISIVNLVLADDWEEFQAAIIQMQ